MSAGGGIPALIGLAALGMAAMLCLVRLVIGPTAFDRVLAFDCLALDLVGIVLMDAIVLGSGRHLDVVLVVALLGFVGTIALAAYLEGRRAD